MCWFCGSPDPLHGLGPVQLMLGAAAACTAYARLRGGRAPARPGAGAPQPVPAPQGAPDANGLRRGGDCEA